MEQEIAFRSTAVRAEGDGELRVEGDLTIVGTTKPIAFELEIGDDGALRGDRLVTQTDWEMKPYSALFGALKVADEVEVDGRGPPAASVAVDGLRVEAALDARRQRAGAVRVQGDVLDRLHLVGVAAVTGDPARRSTT